MKFENTEVFNIKGAMRGMRFPMKGDHLSDTFSETIGNRDLDLAQRLWAASEKENLAHSKFLRQIFVSVDITAPLYWWSEMDTYKIGTTANSESTMHKLVLDSKTLSIEGFGELEPVAKDFIKSYVIPKLKEVSEDTSLKSNEKLKTLKQILPTSFHQKRHWTSNYEVIRNIWNQRVHSPHRLGEWTGIGLCGESFNSWARTLPYFEHFIDKGEG